MTNHHCDDAGSSLRKMSDCLIYVKHVGSTFYAPPCISSNTTDNHNIRYTITLSFTELCTFCMFFLSTTSLLVLCLASWAKFCVILLWLSVVTMQLFAHKICLQKWPVMCWAGCKTTPLTQQNLDPMFTLKTATRRLACSLDKYTPENDKNKQTRNWKIILV